MERAATSNLLHWMDTEGKKYMKKKKPVGYYVIDVREKGDAASIRRVLEVPDQISFAQLAYVLCLAFGADMYGEPVFYSNRPQFVIYNYDSREDTIAPREGLPYELEREYICDFFQQVKTVYFTYRPDPTEDVVREFTLKVKLYEEGKRYFAKMVKASGEVDMDVIRETNRLMEEQCRLNYRAFARGSFEDICRAMCAGRYGFGARYTAPETYSHNGLPKSVILSVRETMEEYETDRMLRELLRDAVANFSTAQPPTLLDILRGFSKEELLTVLDNKEIDVRRGIPRVKLAEILTEAMMEEGVLRRYYMLLSDIEMKTLRRYLKNQSRFTYDDDKDVLSILFASCYIATTPTGEPALAQDVARMLKALDTPENQEERRRRHWLFTCIAAADFLYGVTPLSVLSDLYAIGGYGKMTKKELVRWIEEIPPEFVTGEVDHDRFISDGIVGEEVQIILEMQENKPYYVPKSKEEVVSFAKGKQLQGETELNNLEKFFGGFDYEPDEIYEIMERTRWHFLSGAPVGFVMENLEDEDYTYSMGRAEKRTLENLLTRLYETTRSIANRGNTPQELKAATAAKQVVQKRVKTAKVVFLKDRKK